MKNFIASLFLSNRFFWVNGSIVFLFATGFFVPWLFPVAQAFVFLSFAVTVVDGFIIYNPRIKVNCYRLVPNIFTLGDENNITIKVHNASPLALNYELIDEIPWQFQLRNHYFSFTLGPNDKKTIIYSLTPKERGVYIFKDIHIYAKTSIGFLQRHFFTAAEKKVAVYPSVKQMKNYEIKAFERLSNIHGIKKIRRLGHNYEFEQIKNYVKGDDYRSINWKATGRKGSLMVNQYEDEKAQPVYCLIDKSRIMKMPFHNMTLLDYSINTSLVISNIALQKYDKAGLVTFSDKIETTLPAERGKKQVKLMLDTLYKQKTDKNLDANYELLYLTIRKNITNRGLLFLFTNFESIYAMQRVLPVLRKLNKLHLLVVVFFENTELIDFTMQEANTIEEIYYRTIAEKFVTEKESIVYELNKYGIQSLLTKPEDLSINTINKYLELKARRMI